MEWIKIDLNNIPSGEILAANFKQGTFGYKEKVLGFLSCFENNISCENDCELLENCTHYIDLNKHDINT